jgi:hypothetical protein
MTSPRKRVMMGNDLMYAKTCLRDLLFVWVLGLLTIHQAAAADARGFMMGGGVGMLGCPQFLNAMSTARQKGGLGSISGIREIDAYAHYVLGFQTGFNSEAEGIYDIFQSLGDNPAISVLYAIEPWCASNPGKKFSDGLLVLSLKLRAGDKK